ncbi:MAG: DUF4031 domain-containing protein [Actinomycetota bacterium]
MTVLVDAAVWPWRGDRWAHLVSDADLDELHEFAERLGVRRFAFQGDHYDVPTAIRERAVALGAEPTPSRELVKRLRAAGLRLAPARRPARWTILHDGPATPVGALLDRDDGVDRLDRALAGLGEPLGRMILGRRPGTLGVLVETGSLVAERPRSVDAVHLTHPPGESPTVELFVGAA